MKETARKEEVSVTHLGRTHGEKFPNMYRKSFLRESKNIYFVTRVAWTLTNKLYSSHMCSLPVHVVLAPGVSYNDHRLISWDQKETT